MKKLLSFTETSLPSTWTTYHRFGVINWSMCFLFNTGNSWKTCNVKNNLCAHQIKTALVPANFQVLLQHSVYFANIRRDIIWNVEEMQHHYQNIRLQYGTLRQKQRIQRIWQRKPTALQKDDCYQSRQSLDLRSVLHFFRLHRIEKFLND